METLEQIKSAAHDEAKTIELRWENLDNPTYRADFIATLQKTADLIPELEDLFTKLANGKSVLFPNEETPLSYPDMEQYTRVVGDELYSAYILQDLYTRYQLIEDIIKLEYPNDREN